MSIKPLKADPGIGREAAPVGTREWAERVRLTMQGLVSHIDSDPKTVKWYVDLVKSHEAWLLMNKPDGSFFRTFEEFCEHRQPWGLGRPWRELKLYLLAVCDGNEAVVEALTMRPSVDNGGKREGAGRPAPPQSAAAVDRVAHASKPPQSQAKNQVDHGKPDCPPKGGNSSEYLVRRIARDAPAIHERMKAGEFKSVRQAAKAAPP